MKKMKVVGTHPEIIRLSRVLAALDSSEAIEQIIVHTGQKYVYELNQIIFEDLGIRKPDYFLVAAEKTATGTIGTEKKFRPVSDYSMPNVSEKVVRIILSYTDYVNRVV